MRAALIAYALLAAACASAGDDPGATGDDSGDDSSGDDSGDDGSSDGGPGTPCNDLDGDGVCQALDVCAGDDRLDSDTDTIPDACDQCPGADDRIDANANQMPDCTELGPLMSVTIPLKMVGANAWRGRHGNQLANDSDLDNTYTGSAFSLGTANSYMVFTLAGFTATIVESVTLRTDVALYGDAGMFGATETVSVWDVTTPAATVEGTNTVQPTIFADLMSGISYGTFDVVPANVNTTIEVPLNASANTDVKAKIGQDFVLGFHLDTPEGYVNWSLNTEARTHQLVITYR